MADKCCKDGKCTKEQTQGENGKDKCCKGKKCCKKCPMKNPVVALGVVAGLAAAGYYFYTKK
uniref:Cysteine-rich protein n=1 Tax=Spironucleus salmonicida TaxID=348837 RepID=V6M7B5_9EUKA|eukprot:EST49324.1 Cysteine-rich protein [Spironucleus salmonicida]